MIKASAQSFFLLCFLAALTCPSCKSPAKPEPPKPRADIRFEIQNQPVQFSYNFFSRMYYCYYIVVVSEHNGVGARVTTVKSEIFEGSTLCSTNTESGGSVGPNGTLEVACYIEVRDEYRFDLFKITVTGTDNNGYSFSVTNSTTINWPSLYAFK